MEYHSIICSLLLICAVHLFLWMHINYRILSFPTKKIHQNEYYFLINENYTVEHKQIEKRREIINETQRNTRIKSLDSEVNERSINNKKEIDTPYVKVAGLRLYIYSAIIDNSFRDDVTKTVLVHGWQHKSVTGNRTTCCIMLYNRTVLSYSGTSVSPTIYLTESNLKASIYTCLINADVKEIKGVSLRIDNSTCIPDMTYYVKPIIKEKNQHSSDIGVCAQHAYGALDAKKLIEWFEVHRLFGVNTVIVYTYKLNNDAFKVLQYYETLGLAVIIRGYDAPEKDRYPREVGEETHQVWDDLQVILLDCVTRLDGYKYVAIIDADEYIVPNVTDFKGAWIKFFQKMFSNNNIAGITFATQYHVTTWGPSNLSSQLTIGRYLNTTGASLDRPKNVYMPSRVIQEYTEIHTYLPQKGFKGIYVDPNAAANHHFRECRKEWLNPAIKNTTHYINVYRPLLSSQEDVLCFDFQRYREELLLHVANAVEANVTRIIEMLAIEN